MKRIMLNVNGVDRWVVAEKSATLAHVLREQMLLTGCKVCCEDGQCGSCTVIINGKPDRCCTTPLEKVPADAKIVTIEGLGTAGEPASAAGRLDGAWRRTVRHLHAGLHHVGQGAARPQSVADPRGGARLVQPQPQSLPLHRLQAAGRRGDGRGRDAARRADRRPGDGQGERERLDPRHALSSSIRARQGHGNVGLRRRYRPAHAARHAPSGADAGEGPARPHQDASTPAKPRRCPAS